MSYVEIDLYLGSAFCNSGGASENIQVNTYSALEPKLLWGFSCAWCDRVYTKKEFPQTFREFLRF